VALHTTGPQATGPQGAKTQITIQSPIAALKALGHPKS
jgi:hypothetical protein